VPLVQGEVSLPRPTDDVDDLAEVVADVHDDLETRRNDTSREGLGAARSRRRKDRSPALR